VRVTTPRYLDALPEAPAADEQRGLLAANGSTASSQRLAATNGMHRPTGKALPQ
jgi:RecB family endonuclease NucS